MEKQKAALTTQLMDVAKDAVQAGSVEERHDSILTIVKKVRGRTC